MALKLLRRVRHWLGRNRVEADLATELEVHRALAQEQLEASGLSADEAARASRRALGNVTLAREDVRAVWISRSFDNTWQDLRIALRGLRRNPGFAAVAVITLALGIGVNTAMFSVLEAVLLRPLPYPDADQLVMVWTDDRAHGVREHPTSYLTFLDWRTESRQFTDLAVFQGEPAIVAGPSGTERVLAQAASANLFSLLGVRPTVGRTFTAEEEDLGEPVVVISHSLWLRQYGGSPDVIGDVLTIGAGRSGQVRHRIVGVMPAGFYFPNKDVQLWRPTASTYVTAPPRWRTQPRFRFIVNDWGVIGRLRAASTVDQAHADLTAIGQRLAIAYPTSSPQFPGFAVRVVPLLDQLTGLDLKQAIWMLFGAVSVVLLIACVNVANLLLARGVARRQEFAIRAALGSSRGRLVRQSLTETAVLTIVAGLLGLVLAGAGMRALAAFGPAGVYPTPSASYPLTDSVEVPVGSVQPGIPRLDEIAIDRRILAFTIAASAVAALFFGLAPARRMSRIDPRDALAEGRAFAGSRSLSRMRNVLVAVECGLSVLLLVGAGLLIRSLARLDRVDPGFDSRHVLVLRVSVAPGGGAEAATATDDIALRREFYEQARARIRAVPGVEGVGLITDFLVRGTADAVTIPGRPPEPGGDIGVARVDPGFFSTLRVPLLRGRFFSDTDAETSIQMNRMSVEDHKRYNPAEPALVNEMFARRFFPGDSPVGKRFGVGPDTRTWWRQIVGVVGNMRRDGLDRAPVAEYFAPYIGQTSELVVRTSGDPLAISNAVREAIRGVGPSAIVMSVSTLDRKLAELDAHRRLQSALLTLFAGLALLMAAVGIFGVVRYSVVQRTREMGIRVALGARTADILRLIVGRGMIAPIAGLAVGLAVALGLTRVLASALFETSPTDPITMGTVALILVTVAIVACVVPAHLASRVDPVVALRNE